jgi:hypothetical protein
MIGFFVVITYCKMFIGLCLHPTLVLEHFYSTFNSVQLYSAPGFHFGAKKESRNSRTLIKARNQYS